MIHSYVAHLMIDMKRTAEDEVKHDLGSRFKQISLSVIDEFLRENRD